eukprot:5768965-Amphidinium_carterae.1
MTGTLAEWLAPSKIGIECDFVSIGGNSVLAGRVTSRLRKIFKLRLPGTALYKFPTPAQLSQLIREMCKAEGVDPDVPLEDARAISKYLPICHCPPTDYLSIYYFQISQNDSMKSSGN